MSDNRSITSCFLTTVKSVVNVQLAFHPDNNNGLKANLYNILNGHPSIGDMYIERIPMDRIDASSDESISQFLMDMYKKKVRI